MRAFAEAYSDQEFVQQVVAQLPRGHQVGGRYFEDCNEAEPNRAGSRRGVAPLRAGRRGGRASLAGFVGHAGLVIGAMTADGNAERKLVAEARYVSNTQLLSIPFRSELIREGAYVICICKHIPLFRAGETNTNKGRWAMNHRAQVRVTH